MLDRAAHVKNFFQEADDFMRELHGFLSSADVASLPVETTNEIFRIMHSIKGNAAFLGFRNLSGAANRMEDFLSAVQTRKIAVDRKVIQILWQGIELISRHLEILKNVPLDASEPLIDGLKLWEQIDRAVKREAAPVPVAPGPYRSTDDIGFVCGTHDVTRLIFIIRYFFDKAQERALDVSIAEKFTVALKELAAVFAEIHQEEARSIACKMISDFEAFVGDDGQIKEHVFRMLSDSFSQIRVHIAEAPLKKEFVFSVSAPADKGKATFRIESEKIDELLGVVRKFKPMIFGLSHVRNAIMKNFTDHELVLNLQRVIDDLDFLTNDLMQLVIRMKTASPALLLDRLEQIAFSLAKSSSKRVRVKVVGREIYVGRGTMEALERVLPHIVRNSIDHGIESPEERRVLGKEEDGLILIEAQREGNRVLVTVADDGRGIDFEELRSRYRKSVFLSGSSKDPAVISQEELLFAEGISTKDAVSESSGRGIGLSAVKAVLQKAGGSIEVSSELGKGAKFVLALFEES